MLREGTQCLHGFKETLKFTVFHCSVSTVALLWCPLLILSRSSSSQIESVFSMTKGMKIFGGQGEKQM